VTGLRGSRGLLDRHVGAGSRVGQAPAMTNWTRADGLPSNVIWHSARRVRSIWSEPIMACSAWNPGLRRTGAQGRLGGDKVKALVSPRRRVWAACLPGEFALDPATGKIRTLFGVSSGLRTTAWWRSISTWKTGLWVSTGEAYT